MYEKKSYNATEISIVSNSNPFAIAKPCNTIYDTIALLHIYQHHYWLVLKIKLTIVSLHRSRSASSYDQGVRNEFLSSQIAVHMNNQ